MSQHRVTALAWGKRLGLLACLSAPAAPALAHSAPQILRIVWRPDQPEVLLQTNRGLIFGEPASQHWRLLCNEALHLNSGELPSMAYVPGGRLLVATSRGLRSTGDQGCSWTTVFEDLLVPALAQDPRAPERIYVATFLNGMASENVSGSSAIRVSDDGGEQFRDLRVMADNDFVNALRVAPSRAQRIYASGTVYASTGPQLYLLRSDDGGESWQRFDAPREPGDHLFTLLAVSPTDPDVVLAQMQPDEPEVMPERLLISRNGGQSWSNPNNVMKLSDAAFSSDGQTVWLVGLGGLQRSDDAGERFAPVGDGAELTCAVEHDGALHTCGWYDGRTAGARKNGVGRSEDRGDSYTPWMTFQDVTEPVQCDDPAIDATCATPFADWKYELDNMFSAASLLRDGGTPPSSDAGSGSAELDASTDLDGGVARSDAGSHDEKPSSDGCSVLTMQHEQRWLPAWSWLAALAAILRRWRRRATR